MHKIFGAIAFLLVIYRSQMIIKTHVLARENTSEIIDEPKEDKTKVPEPEHLLDEKLTGGDYDSRNGLKDAETTETFFQDKPEESSKNNDQAKFHQDNELKQTTKTATESERLTKDRSVLDLDHPRDGSKHVHPAQSNLQLYYQMPVQTPVGSHSYQDTMLLPCKYHHTQCGKHSILEHVPDDINVVEAERDLEQKIAPRKGKRKEATRVHSEQSNMLLYYLMPLQTPLGSKISQETILMFSKDRSLPDNNDREQFSKNTVKLTPGALKNLKDVYGEGEDFWMLNKFYRDMTSLIPVLCLLYYAVDILDFLVKIASKNFKEAATMNSSKPKLSRRRII